MVWKVGLDIDRRDGSDVEAAVRAHPAASWLKRRHSANGKLHYLVGLRRSIDTKASLLLRQHLGDDPTRILADRDRIRHGQDFDVLYASKGNAHATPWETIWTRETDRAIC